MSDSPILFEVMTPLGFTVRTTESYWQYIVTIKHPDMSDCIQDVQQTLVDPDEIRQSKQDENIHVFYRRDPKRLFCAVARRLNGDGFLITTYQTRNIKEGIQIWLKYRSRSTTTQ